MKKIGQFPLFFIALISISTFFSFNNTSERENQTEAKDDVIILDASDKSIAFSRIAKPGKISIFILAAHWCGPCKDLKEAFEAAYDNGRFSKNDLDVYYCLLSKNNSDNTKEMDERSGYRNFKYVDQLTEYFPTSYILTPTTNCYTIVKGNKTNEIFKHIEDLIEIKNNYFDINYLEYETKDFSVKRGFKYDAHNEALEKENIQLRQQIAQMQAENSGRKSMVINNTRISNTSNSADACRDEKIRITKISCKLNKPGVLRLVFDFNRSPTNEEIEDVKNNTRIQMPSSEPGCDDVRIENEKHLSGLSISDYKAFGTESVYYNDAGTYDIIFTAISINSFRPIQAAKESIYSDMYFSKRTQ